MKVFSKIILVLGAIFLIIRIFFNNITKLDIVNRNAGIIAFVLLVLLIISELYIKIKKNEV
ncbi:hypothetical protein DW712_03935 [Bacteroides intestinalis]|uniref:Uncharacterized protein n=1 Tax=Bacteroides intestinalis TaxID=329854 RepID=A0A414LIF5_9BACE|nr:hypothetical protein DW712_03935 [Bacteroides intestinalis]